MTGLRLEHFERALLLLRAGLETRPLVELSILEQRNLMAHTYDRENFEKAIAGITERYAAALRQLFDFLK